MDIALLIPCLNEEKTIGKVIKDFQKALPEAKLYVGDNNSTDKTVEIAESLGASIIRENRPGKGYMVHRLLIEVKADIYIMVDGDDTYRAQDIHQMLKPVIEGKYDMCVGNRLKHFEPGSFSHFHLLGNKLIRLLTFKLHGVDIPDMLTGYRVMRRGLVDKICLILGGFEVETEINIKSVWHGFTIYSVDVEYGLRPSGSTSKIKTFQDGYRILSTIFMLLREHQPLTMGGISFLTLGLIGIILAIWGIVGGSLFAFTLGLFSLLLGSVALGVGIILHAINISHREDEVHYRKLLRIKTNN